MLKIKWIGIAIGLLIGVLIIQWHIDDLLLSLVVGIIGGYSIGFICANGYMNERYK